MEKLKTLYNEYKIPYDVFVNTDYIFYNNVGNKIINTSKVTNKVIDTTKVTNKVSNKIVNNTSKFKMKIKPLRLFTYSTKFPKVLSGDIYKYLIKITEINGRDIRYEDIHFCLYCYPRNSLPYIGKLIFLFKEKIKNCLIFSIKFCECSFRNDNADFTLNAFCKGQMFLTSTKFKIFARRRIEEKIFWEKF